MKNPEIFGKGDTLMIIEVISGEFHLFQRELDTLIAHLALHGPLHNFKCED